MGWTTREIAVSDTSKWLPDTQLTASTPRYFHQSPNELRPFPDSFEGKRGKPLGPYSVFSILQLGAGLGASLVAQWLRIRLPMQGPRVQALGWEDSTCRGATKPLHHNYWACALEPVSHNYWACVPQLLKPAHLEPVLRNKKSHHNEKPAHCNEE